MARLEPIGDGLYQFACTMEELEAAHEQGEPLTLRYVDERGLITDALMEMDESGEISTTMICVNERPGA